MILFGFHIVTGDLLQEIAKYLDGQSYGRLGLTCKKLYHEIFQRPSNPEWERLLQKDFIINFGPKLLNLPKDYMKDFENTDHIEKSYWKYATACLWRKHERRKLNIDDSRNLMDVILSMTRQTFKDDIDVVTIRTIIIEQKKLRSLNQAYEWVFEVTHPLTDIYLILRERIVFNIKKLLNLIRIMTFDEYEQFQSLLFNDEKVYRIWLDYLERYRGILH
jgi:hypothetical protein